LDRDISFRSGQQGTQLQAKAINNALYSGRLCYRIHATRQWHGRQDYVGSESGCFDGRVGFKVPGSFTLMVHETNSPPQQFLRLV
jgi:hypothetical protein